MNPNSGIDRKIGNKLNKTISTARSYSHVCLPQQAHLHSRIMSTLLRRTKTALEKLAPLSLAEPWDNVGVLVDPPYPRPSASKVFLTIDFTEAVAEEALGDETVGVVVAYHPPIFRTWKRLEMPDVKQRIIMKCIAKGLGIYSPHTAVDACSGGGERNDA